MLKTVTANASFEHRKHDTFYSNSEFEIYSYLGIDLLFIHIQRNRSFARDFFLIHKVNFFEAQTMCVK